MTIRFSARLTYGYPHGYLTNSVRVGNPSDILNVRTEIRANIFSGTLRSWKKGVTDILTDILGTRTEGGSLVGTVPSRYALLPNSTR